MSGGQSYTADGVGLALTAGQFSLQTTYKYLSADAPSVNGTATTGLSCALVANTKYRFHVFIAVVVANASTAMNFQIHTGPTLVASMGFWEVAGGNNVLAESSTGFVTAVTTNLFPNNLPSNGLTYIAHIHGVVTQGAGAGTLQVDMVDNATTDTVKAGSFLEAFPIA